MPLARDKLGSMKRFHAVAALLVLPVSFAVHAQAAGQPSATTKEAGPAMHHDKANAVLSTTLRVDTGNGAPMTFTVDDLKTIPQHAVPVKNGHSGEQETYDGPLLSDILAKAGFALTEKNQGSMLRSVILAGGTDKYFVVYSAAEVQRGLHDADVIVALTRNGGSLGQNGLFQLINNRDVKPARWVRNLASITVKPVAP